MSDFEVVGKQRSIIESKMRVVDVVIVAGFFRANGGCGYVKKPEFLIEKGPYNEVFDPKRTLPVKKTLKVRDVILKRKSVSL